MAEDSEVGSGSGPCMLGVPIRALFLPPTMPTFVARVAGWAESWETWEFTWDSVWDSVWGSTWDLIWTPLFALSSPD